MATLITNLQPATELEAVNAMLGAIGEAPLDAGTDLSTVDHADVAQALRLLREQALTVQLERWRFNTEFAVEVAPTATQSWTDTDGTVTTLNVFKRPANVVAWSQTVCVENRDLDLVERPSKKYLESAKPVLVLYDRTYNRDGAKQSDFPYVYLDTISAFDFEQCPACIRRLITIKAARLLAEQAAGSETLAGFSVDDEREALRLAKRDEGEDNNWNILNTIQAQGMRGARNPALLGGFVGRTVRPGSV